MQFQERTALAEDLCCQVLQGSPDVHPHPGESESRPCCRGQSDAVVPRECQAEWTYISPWARRLSGIRIHVTSTCCRPILGRRTFKGSSAPGGFLAARKYLCRFFHVSLTVKVLMRYILSILRWPQTEPLQTLEAFPLLQTSSIRHQLQKQARAMLHTSGDS